MANAGLKKAEFAQKFLTAIDHAKFFARDFRSVRNTRRQTRGCRLVPGRQAQLSRKFPNVFLAKPGLNQRTSNLQFATGLTAGPIIARIVQVVAIDYIAETTINRDRLQPAVELVFAKITAVGRIGDIVRVSHFGRRDDFMAQPEFADKIQRNGTLMRWVTRALRSNRKCITSKDL